MHTRRGRVEGIVQGVGFRPFVAGLARALGLRGWVENRGGHVELLVAGETAALDEFARRLRDEAPRAANIEALSWTEASGLEASGPEAVELGPEDEFHISGAAPADDGRLAIGPDLRVCDACLAEIQDPRQRRHGYAMTSCTACGPRLSIALSSPWSRAHSSLAPFDPCVDCQGEFADPSDRRWHAEAIACPRCGPDVALEDLSGRRLAGPDRAIAAAIGLLRRGQILGLRGVGGFQLLVDARSQSAVERLRVRKRRPLEPLALMVADLDAAAELVELDGLARATLTSAVGPIALLARAGPPGPGRAVAEAVAPEQPRLGLMLATTPAHALLLAGFGGPLVATSGNVHDRPIALTIEAARIELADVADALLVHDREIQRRCDDSVVQLVAGEVRTLRLGRGLAPTRVELPAGRAPTLALGAHLQHTPAYAGEGRALIWPYVGDLDEADTRAAMQASLADLCAVIGRDPRRLVCDAHPDYATTLWAQRAAAADPELRVERVLHHHAHVAAVLAEHGRDRALGVAWDGAGFGADRSSWGGEFLAVEGASWRRLASLRSFALAGGEAAARDGLRVLAGMLVGAELPAPSLAGVDARELERLMDLARRPRLSPPSSAAGRLFDAIAALVGVRRRSRYQAEAARALEHAAAAHGPAPAYAFELTRERLDWQPMLASAIAERDRPGLVAARVHATLIAMIVAVADRHRATTVALAGGCFANTILLAGAIEALGARGIEVLAPRRLPPGDAGLALGQAAVAGWREERPSCA